MSSKPLRKPVRTPPKDLSKLSLKETLLPSAGWVRLHWPGALLKYSKNDEHRFSPMNGRYEALYIARDELTAALEVFGGRLYNKTNVTISRAEWHTREFTKLRMPPLKVADLTGTAMATARVTLGTLASCNRSVIHKWGRAIMEHPNNYSGFLFLSDYTAKPCLVLFNCPNQAKPVSTASPVPFASWTGASKLLRDYRVTLL